jgi:hypothetical protein
MFAPLSFLGSIYTSIVQGLIDVKHLLNLLTESRDIIDADDADELVVIGSPSSKRIKSANLKCRKCSRSLNSDWMCCPFCGTEATSRDASLTQKVATFSPLIDRSVKNNGGEKVESNGVSVEFEGRVLVEQYRDVIKHVSLCRCLFPLSTAIASKRSKRCLFLCGTGNNYRYIYIYCYYSLSVKS